MELIKCWNPEWRRNRFDYNNENLILKVTGPNLKILAGSNNESSKLSFLRLIKVNHLNIANSQIASMRQINGTSAKTLDIRGSSMRSVRGINLVLNINRLIANEDQLPEEESRHLPESIQFDPR